MDSFTKNLSLVIFFFVSKNLLASPGPDLKKVPKDFQLVAAHEERILLGVNSQNALVLLDLKNPKPMVLTKDPRASANFIFHTQKPWLAYIETQPETFKQRLHVYDFNVDAEIFKSTPFKLSLFLDWLDPCRIVVGTTEENPAQAYQFKVAPLCDSGSAIKRKTKSLWTVFSNGSPVNWGLDFGLEFKEIPDLSMGLVYSARPSLDDNLVFTTDKGGIFVLSRETSKIIAKQDSGFRPKLHTKKPWVLFEVPGNGFRVWNYSNQKILELKNIQGAQSFWGDSGVIYQDKKGIGIHTLNWSGL